MLKEEIVEKISKYFKLTSFEAEKIYDDIFSIIVSGVKQDNIVDVANFGEFIIKFNKGNGDSAEANGYKKTVEFLATSKLEDDINQNVGETVYMTPSISETAQINQTISPPVTEAIVEPVISKVEETPKNTSNPVEEELRRKREEILGRISKPVEEIPKAFRDSGLTKPLWKIPTAEKEKVQEKTAPVEIVQKVAVTEEHTEKEEILQDVVLKPLDEEKKVEVKKAEEKKAEEKKTEEKKAEVKKTEETEDLSKKTFSDFFTEVKQDNQRSTAKIEETVEQPALQNVIPPSVVELHNEITSSGQHESMTFPTIEASKTPVTANGNGNGIGTGEYRASDNSYYIWYKDVEANATDTQNLSYEYELLYQATKEAEYKSKLKIYVTTFIIFFSIVLVLLIFSPVIYKIFFKPVETAPTTESVNEEKPVTEQTSPNNKAEQNVLPNSDNTNTQSQTTQQNNANGTPPVTGNDRQQTNTTQNTTQQNNDKQNTEKQNTNTETKTEQPVQQQTSQPPVQQQQTQTQPKQEPKMDGVTQNSMGWMDDKFKVIYVKLDNGKFTIQESAWDSDTKANRRIGVVHSYKIDGLSGSIVKADLGTKGTWFRARFGEFSTLEQARQKAEELRKKEGLKLQASLLLFLLTA